MMNLAVHRENWIQPTLWVLMLIFAWSLILSIAVVQSVTLLMTVLWLVHRAVTREWKFKRTDLDIAYACFVLARLISIPFSINLSASVEALTKEVIYYGLFFVVTQEFPIREKDAVKWIFWSFIGAGMIASIYGSIVYFLGAQGRATSTVSGPVTLGMYLTAVTSMVLILGRNRSFFPRTWMWIITTAILVIGVVSTLNRIHWGLMLLMMGIIGILRERKLLFLLVIGSAIAVLSPPVASRLSSSLSSVSEFMNGRDVIWLDALEHAAERPLVGFGPRTFHDVFTGREAIRDKRVGSWHNDYLQMYMESGLLGLGGFLWVMFVVFRKGWSAWKILKGDPFWRDVVLALLLAMIAFYVSGLVGGFVIDPLNSLFHRFLLGILALVILHAPTLSSDVAEAGGPNCHEFTPEGNTDLLTIADLIRSAKCVVTPDTSIIHIASAVQTPVLGFYTPLRVTNEWMPFGVKYDIVLAENGRPVSSIPTDIVAVRTKAFLGGIRPRTLIKGPEH
ncbi:MAG: O-antigen ligase family protein [Bacteroidota bacterium]